VLAVALDIMATHTFLIKIQLLQRRQLMHRCIRDNQLMTDSLMQVQIEEVLMEALDLAPVKAQALVVLDKEEAELALV